MATYYILYIYTLIIIILVNINTSPSSIDLSDKNPIVYCLKAAKRYTFEEVKEYLLRTQVPGEAEDYAIDDPEFSYCVEQASRDN